MQKGKFEATYSLTNVSVPDWFNLGNALLGGDSSPGVASFTVKWFDPQQVVTVDATNNTGGFGPPSSASHDWGGRFAVTNASIEFSARNDQGFSYKSDPASTSSAHPAFLGVERNGYFFTHPGDTPD